MCTILCRALQELYKNVNVAPAYLHNSGFPVRFGGPFGPSYQFPKTSWGTRTSSILIQFVAIVKSFCGNGVPMEKP